MFDKNLSSVEIEKIILKYWKDNDCFNKSNVLSKDREKFTFYDGPPFATGLPHYGHILAGTIKDVVTRYKYQQGYHVDRRFGWDCHGLPVEYEIDKTHNITNRDQVHKMGIDKYNDLCKSIVMKYSSEWKVTVGQMGRWVDFDNGYKTMDKKFMDSVWFIFKQLFDKNYVYRGYKVMPFSSGCMTPLSNFEANQNYKNTLDPSIVVSFELKEDFEGHRTSFLIWTTTPWTLPSNCGCVLNESFTYVLFEANGKRYIIVETRVEEYFKDFKIIEKISGKDLVGLEYLQPFNYFEHLRKFGYFRLYAGDFVTDSDGTGIVHCSPGFGEDDYNVFVKYGLIKRNDLVPCPVDENGKFTKEISDFEGLYIKDADPLILKALGDKLIINEKKHHNYPYCWRSETPLIYKLVPNWFIRVTDSVDKLLANNEKINWVPKDIKYKKFHNWLADAKDWSFSRNRFWGTPIPLWTNEDYSVIYCVESAEELEKLSGKKITDIHRQFIDDIEIVVDGVTLKRIPEVFDCWFESGSMPYAQNNWPFCLKDKFNMNEIKEEITTKEECSSKDTVYNDMVLKNFPADFIAEGIDQTRGWFYTLHVISTLLFNKPAFKNVVVNGIVLAEDGHKMSKSKKNYPSPDLILNEFGADSLRSYLISSPVVEAQDFRFKKDGVKEVLKTLIIPWMNSLLFYTTSKSTEPEELVLDNWIKNSFNDFLSKVEETMNKYELSKVIRYALQFIDDLSNWYIRIHRKEIKDGSSAVLRELLEGFSIIMAPFTPFFSEYCYQTTSKGESVHFEMYPKKFETQEDTFESAKEVIEAIRSIREQKQISLKTPICEATFYCSLKFRNRLDRYLETITKECNVLKISFKDEDAISVTLKAKPYFENLKKDMKTMKKKMNIISKFTEKDIENILQRDLEYEGLVIKKDDVMLVKELTSDKDGLSKVAHSFILTLNNTLTKEVLELRDAREFNSFIQQLRKKLGLKIEDNVYIDIQSDYIKEVCSKHFNIVFGTEGEKVGEEQYVKEGNEYKVTVYQT
ncbi:Isoleucyl-tRNA synthetase, cytoplasmic [Nosema bombycis CQ1]|uniref:Probable isoleucine--tRNA ligase, cytoplasmic n=1 Tax=Nosema bombycis (strain CQ1 / CVCC 102059) TaxID=578461 RepID=R0MDF6_NOSB1|nr:Isoleucyl-tRNA synthetase, cytoplasmic [Nosema bombycis CQ1]|eukprot:EOB12110.1 Isoleucyl-tRNA synthetase, cytoplasmic [Nosema bombycis CQ1]